MTKTHSFPSEAKNPMMKTYSLYLNSVYKTERFQKTVRAMVIRLASVGDDFDAIVFRGSSGAALGYVLGYLLEKPIINCRKAGENSHSQNKVEGCYGAARIAVVDDFVCSGKTIRVILEDVGTAYEQLGFKIPVFAHLFLYAARCGDSAESVRAEIGPEALHTKIHLHFDSY